MFAVFVPPGSLLGSHVPRNLLPPYSGIPERHLFHFVKGRFVAWVTVSLLGGFGYSSPLSDAACASRFGLSLPPVYFLHPGENMFEFELPGACVPPGRRPPVPIITRVRDLNFHRSRN